MMNLFLRVRRINKLIFSGFGETITKRVLIVLKGSRGAYIDEAYHPTRNQGDMIGVKKPCLGNIFLN